MVIIGILIIIVSSRSNLRLTQDRLDAWHSFESKNSPARHRSSQVVMQRRNLFQNWAGAYRNSTTEDGLGSSPMLIRANMPPVFLGYPIGEVEEDATAAAAAAVGTEAEKVAEECDRINESSLEELNVNSCWIPCSNVDYLERNAAIVTALSMVLTVSTLISSRADNESHCCLHHAVQVREKSFNLP